MRSLLRVRVQGRFQYAFDERLGCFILRCHLVRCVGVFSEEIGDEIAHGLPFAGCGKRVVHAGGFDCLCVEEHPQRKQKLFDAFSDQQWALLKRVADITNGPGDGTQAPLSVFDDEDLLGRRDELAEGDGRIQAMQFHGVDATEDLFACVFYAFDGI